MVFLLRNAVCVSALQLNLDQVVLEPNKEAYQLQDVFDLVTVLLVWVVYTEILAHLVVYAFPKVQDVPEVGRPHAHSGAPLDLYVAHPLRYEAAH